MLLEHGADINLQNKVSFFANIVCVSVCLAAMHLAYSTTIIVLCGCRTENNIARHMLSLFLTKGIYYVLHR